MDASKIVEALQLTLNPDPTKKGENLLNEMHKVIGFTPLLLQISLEERIAAEIRQASVIYFKNNVMKYWKWRDDDSLSSIKENEADGFIIHENDKATIRENIVRALVTLPAPLQIQLKTALGTIISSDYPHKYGNFFNILKEYLVDSNYASLNGGLLALHSFFKCYRYSKKELWQHADQALQALLPGLTELMTRLLQDKSIQSWTLQKLIIKSLSAYSSFHWNPNTFNHDVMPIWIDIFCTILQDINPTYDGESEGVYWKLKKWAINIIVSVFDCFGTPGVVSKSLKEFSEYFFNTFTQKIIELCIGLLLSKNYISPRVKASCIMYLSLSLVKAQAWKMVKPHFPALLESVLHPLLCHNDEDEELWEEDPNEYIHYRLVYIDSAQNPSMKAFAMLESASAKRRGILQMIMEFCMVVLQSSQASEMDKDGVLHIIGAISQSLLKRKGYSNQLENFLVNFVFPTLRSPLRFRRMRACWLMYKLADAKFNNIAILNQAITAVYDLMMNDSEKPVQVSAAQALTHVCKDQEKAREALKDHLADILMKLISLLKDTAFDEINQFISICFDIYPQEILPIALNLISQITSLVNHFIVPKPNINKDGDDADKIDEDENLKKEETMFMLDSAISNIETILSACTDHQELLDKAEPDIINCLKNVLLYKCEDLYQSAFYMFLVLQTNQISPQQWQVFDWFYEVFQNGFSTFFFDDSVTVLHRFITFQPEQFLSNPNRLNITCDMLFHVMSSDTEFDSEPEKAAKLLECLLLDYRESMQPFIPKIVEVTLLRYCRTDETCNELRTMCLQLISAAMFIAPSVVLHILMSHPWPESNVPMFDTFLKISINNVKQLCGLHDRRVFVLMVCKLLSLPAENRPAILESLQAELMQQTLSVMQKLPSMYSLRAKLDEDSDDDSEDEEEEDESEDEKGIKLEEGLASDEDEIQEENADYNEYLENLGNDEVDELNELEMFDTILDKEEHDREEFVVFYQTMIWLEQNQPEWYSHLINPLVDDQKEYLATIAETARKTIQMKESKLIEQAGGFDFRQTSVPTSFDFGGNV